MVRIIQDEFELILADGELAVRIAAALQFIVIQRFFADRAIIVMQILPFHPDYLDRLARTIRLYRFKARAADDKTALSADYFILSVVLGQSRAAVRTFEFSKIFPDHVFCLIFFQSLFLPLRIRGRPRP